MSKDNYHTDISTLSSSMLKTILEDPAKFKREYIDGQRKDGGAAHFVEGSYVHSLILEPHKTDLEFIIYDGFVKRGGAFDAFSSANGDKTILSVPQKHRCMELLKAYNARPEAVALITGGEAEHTIQGKILDVPVKCRADYINADQGYIVDVKTTAELSGPEMFGYTIQRFQYDLSASLYCQIAADHYGKLFDFYWVVISKQDQQCHIYKASTQTLSQGTAKYTEALVMYKKCSTSGVWTRKQATKDFSSKDYEIITL